MLAGIMLGPSLFGWLFPNAWAVVFPPTSVPYLNVLSQIGVILFLFLVGLELDPRLIRNRGHAAVVISQASIIAPFMLGAALALFLYTRLFNRAPHMQFRSVALFLGASMSITAFPVLARILTERNLHKTRVGAITITCAAFNDVTAWCLLAFLIGVARAQGLRAGVTTAMLAVLYVLVMYFVVRPFLRRLQMVYERQQTLSQPLVGLILLMVLISGYVTEAIGIHALFGAFLLGTMMPNGSRFVAAVTEKFEDFTVVFLLPVFFAYTGLQTRLGVLSGGEMWFYCGVVIFVACLGKVGGSALAARACGIGWRESGAIGILMNTRGLMELVILNVGRELGVITEAVFAIMVVMALVTTALTTPILHLVYPHKRMEGEQLLDTGAGYSVLIPVSLPASGGPLVQLANAITGSENEDRRIFALYLKRPEERDAYRAGIDADVPPEKTEALQPLLDEAKRAQIPVTPIAFTSRDVASDIARTARLRHADLILMGFHNPVYTSSILGGTVHRVLTGSDSDVAIFVDRGVGPRRKVLIPYLGSKHDRLALEIAGRMARNAKIEVTVLHVTAPSGGDAARTSTVNAKAATDRVFADPTQPLPVTLRTVEDSSPVDAVVEQAKDFDLVIIGVAEEWGLESQLLGFRAERIAQEVACSLLIVRKHGSFRAARGTPPPALPKEKTAKPPPAPEQRVEAQV
jgi:Kef-type K+ transport system membrane component KefB/nucleotide-binding universal stress UspA family protein